MSLARPASAFLHPLSSTNIRDACLSATEPNAATPDFLAQYTHSFSTEPGPYVSSITVVTPYLQVFRRATQGTGYSPQDATEHFLGKPETLRVEITIEGFQEGTPATTSQGVALQISEFWQNYKFTVWQRRKSIAPAKTSSALLFSTYAPSVAGDSVIGVVVTLEFDPEALDSAPTEIQVVAPDGRKIKTKFDLARLK